MFSSSIFSFPKVSNGWKILYSYLGDFKQEILLLSGLGVISALANAGVPYVVGHFFDAIIKPSYVFIGSYHVPLWATFLSAWALMQIVANGVDWVMDNKRRHLGTYLHALYPAKAAEKLLRLPISFHKERKSGQVWDRVTRAGNSISSIMENVVINLAPQFLRIVVGVGIGFVISPPLALIMLGGVALYILILMRILPPIVDLQKKGNKAWNTAFGNAYDAVSNTQTVKQAGAEVYESRKVLRSFIDKAYKIWFQVEKIWINISFYQRAIVALTQLSVFICSVYLISNGTLTIGDLIAINSYAGMIFGPFVTLGMNWQTVQNGLVSIERAEEMFQVPPERYRSGAHLQEIDFRGGIVFENVSFAYKKRDSSVLKNITFEVKPGEVVALVGESGGGKSTLIDLISGYYRPLKGRILVDGQDTKEVDLEALRAAIAVVPQEVVLFNDNIKTNLRYGNLKASDEEVEEAAKEAHANVFIEKFPQKYKQLVGERGVKLSVGQKQRIAIARAILRNPRILILDEPTSALDAETERAITESLDRLMTGRTTFIIAHRLSTVRKADKILFLDGGRIVEQGSHDELMNIPNGKYRRLYELHIGLH